MHLFWFFLNLFYNFFCPKTDGPVIFRCICGSLIETNNNNNNMGMGIGLDQSRKIPRATTIASLPYKLNIGYIYTRALEEGLLECSRPSILLRCFLEVIDEVSDGRFYMTIGWRIIGILQWNVIQTHSFLQSAWWAWPNRPVSKPIQEDSFFQFKSSQF